MYGPGRGHRRDPRGGARHPRPRGRRPRPRRDLRGRPVGQPGETRGVQLLPLQGDGRARRRRHHHHADAELDARLRQLRYMGQSGRQARAPRPGLPGAPRRDAGRLPARQAAPPRGRRSRAAAASRRATPSCSRARRSTARPRRRRAATSTTCTRSWRPGARSCVAYLEARGIGTQLIYPKLVPDQGAYRDHPWRAGRPRRRPLAGAAAALPADVRGADRRRGRPGRRGRSATSTAPMTRHAAGRPRRQRRVHPGADGRHRGLAGRCSTAARRSSVVLQGRSADKLDLVARECRRRAARIGTGPPIESGPTPIAGPRARGRRRRAHPGPRRRPGRPGLRRDVPARLRPAGRGDDGPRRLRQRAAHRAGACARLGATRRGRARRRSSST